MKFKLYSCQYTIVVTVLKEMCKYCSRDLGSNLNSHFQTVLAYFPCSDKIKGVLSEHLAVCLRIPPHRFLLTSPVKCLNWLLTNSNSSLVLLVEGYQRKPLACFCPMANLANLYEIQHAISGPINEYPDPSLASWTVLSFPSIPVCHLFSQYL